MENLHSSDVNAAVIVTNMIDNASKIWESMSSGFKMPGTELGTNGEEREKVFESRPSGYKLWQEFAAMPGENKIFGEVIKEQREGSDNLHKLLKSGWDGCSFFQKKWAESSKNIDDIITMHKTGKHSKSDIFKICNEIYQKEFSRFFSIPSLGLSRGYQEKNQQLLDKSTLFSSALTEFMYFLYVPFEKSSKVVQDTLTEMVQTKRPPKEQKDYYEMWIEQLEKHYVSLFKSSEYIESLSNVISAMSDFKAAQQQISQDYFKLFGIPGEQDMDELYKDIYQLKKRIRTLENENKTAKTY